MLVVDVACVVTERGYKYYGLDPETYWDKIVEECEPSPVVRQPITQSFVFAEIISRFRLMLELPFGLVFIKLSELDPQHCSCSLFFLFELSPDLITQSVSLHRSFHVSDGC
jgi:hypothetical protein